MQNKGILGRKPKLSRKQIPRKIWRRKQKNYSNPRFQATRKILA
jgi:hypothetical protein